MKTLTEAIHQKFLDVNSDLNTNPAGFIIIAPKVDIRNGIPPVLVINCANVDKAGNPEDLKTYLRNVVELDISRNVISDVEEIGGILRHAPKIGFLNLSFNPLSGSTFPSTFPSVNSLKTVIFIGCKPTWEIIWRFLSQAENVSELHLSLNEYSSVKLPEEIKSDDVCHPCEFSKMAKLMFDSNPITEWEEIAKLGKAFPCLHHLSLTGCPIATIPPNGGSSFPNLETMWLCNSQIAELEQFGNLKFFGKLVNLRVNGIPLCANFSEESRRQHYIALLPNIRVLNRGRAITDGDRVTAERNFIRYYQEATDKPARYAELKSIHGEVPKLLDVNFKPPTKAKILIYFQDKEAFSFEVHVKKSVIQLKELLEPLVGLQVSCMDLYFRDPTDDYGGKEFMRFPSKKLYTYHIKDDDEIYVYKKGTVCCGSTVIY